MKGAGRNFSKARQNAPLSKSGSSIQPPSQMVEKNVATFLLKKLSSWFAYIAFLSIIIESLVVFFSILGRVFLSTPLVGDYELVQFFSLLAISFSLPYVFLNKSNIIVEFFTERVSSKKIISSLDRFANFAGFISLLALSFLSFSGLADVYKSGQTTIILEIPLYAYYLPIALGMLLACCVSFFLFFEKTIKGGEK